MPSMSVVTCSIVTPGFIRANTCSAALVARRLLAVLGERHPETLLSRGTRIAAASRRSTVCGRPLIADRAPDDAGIAVVARLPDLVAEHHHRLGARPIVLRTEVAAEDRRLSEQLEQVPGDRRAVVALGSDAPSEIVRLRRPKAAIDAAVVFWSRRSL